MASIGNSREIPNPGYNPWISTAEIDTVTGAVTISVNGGTGRLLYQGSPDVVISQIKLNTQYDKERAFFDNLINVITEQAQTLKSQVQPKPSDTASDSADNKNSDDRGQADELKPKTGTVTVAEGQGETPPAASSNDSLSNNGTPSANGNSTGSSNGSSTATGRSGQLVSRRLYNPLSEFSSVAYRISLYLITPEAFNDFYAQGKWVTSSLELILQSSGVTSGVDSNRNKYFNYDFYIDNLEIATLINGKETGIATNSVDFKFQIIEPYGMTFPSRLVQAQVELQQKTNIKAKMKQQVQALNAPLLLVIRFYGYDNAGNVISKVNNPDTKYSKTDASATFERAFPIIITKMGFKLDNKNTVYDCQAKPINEQIGLGTKRGIVNSLINIKADTVENALSQNSLYGLCAQLNKQQQELTNKPEKERKQQIADVYKVEIVDPIIGGSLIVDKDFYVKSRAPVAQVKNTAEVNVRTAQQTQTVPKDKRVIEIPPGQSVMSAIDQIISQSTYLKRSMKILDGEEVEPTKENEDEYTVNGQPVPLQWYNVVPQIKILGYDNLRNDYAYEITYIVQKYSIPYVRSIATGGTSTSYTGPSKIYNYYYTGDNQEILSYEQQYNLLYFNAASLTSEAANGNNNDVAPNQTMPAQNANPTGKSAGSFELLNNVKTFLYSPGDQIKAQIKILGDPDFIMPAVSGSIQTATEAIQGQDYAINPNTGQVFIEVDFKQVEDYGTSVGPDGSLKFNDDGLLTPNGNIKFWEYPPAIEAVTKGRMVYMVTKVTSRFNKGTFTQELRSILPSFPDVQTTKSQQVRENATSGIQPGQNARDDLLARQTSGIQPGQNARDDLLARQSIQAAPNVTPTNQQSAEDDNSGSSAPAPAKTPEETARE